MTSPEGEFKKGAIEAMARAIFRVSAMQAGITDDELPWEATSDNDREQIWQQANRALDALFAFRLPDQPEGPRVAVVESVGRFTRFPDDSVTAEVGCIGMVWDRPSKSPFPEPEQFVFTLYPDTPETP